MKAAKGNTVTLEYTGTLADGRVFDKTSEKPFAFTVGAGEVIAGFDDAVVGMDIGEEKEFTLSAGNAYGEIKPELVKPIDRKALPQGQEPKEGMTLVIKSEEGIKLPVPITKVTPTHIYVDLNHPLAGRALTFKIRILAVA